MYVTVVIIGAGHAGLAMSRRLTDRSIDHVVLERGEVANSWRTERWDSLRLLTPNWQTRLPGRRYDGHDPDGFMSMPEVVSFIDAYAHAVDAPVQTRTTVARLSTCGAGGNGYEVVTDRGVWTCDSVVVASGFANVAAVPSLAAGVPPAIRQLTAMTYRSPADLDERGVIVVGASATGVQLADEIRRTGRPVTLAVGEHVRLPRTYRGRDVCWWMEAAGVFGERHDEMDDLVRARHLPSPQLIGTPEHRSIDLNALTARGVRIVGRLSGVSDGVAQFSGSLANVCRLADLKMNRLLDRFDEWGRTARPCGVGPPERFEPTRVPPVPTLELDLRRGDIGTIVWATGFRPDHSWVDLPVFDRKQRIRHDGGVVRDAPGVYLLGGTLLRRRSSSFIHGAEADTDDLATHLHANLVAPCSRASTSCYIGV
jgi:putative flavoprotein involved in K+ transport